MKLEMRKGSFAYTQRNVFEDINLEVKDREFLCILGPNGCGKTTLLKCLAGMMKLKCGEVLLDGQKIAAMKRSQVAARIGYVPQEQETTFPFTVQQMVLVGRAPYLNIFSSPSPKDIDIAEEAMERVGISGLKQKRFTELSGGEKQLVLIARVLAQQPRILLLDEPTSHLDFKNQALILNLIKSLAQEGLAVIMTTHFPNHAFSYSTRATLMHKGVFLGQGAPERVLTEQNLRLAYDIDVKIYSVVDTENFETLRFCTPA